MDIQQYIAADKELLLNLNGSQSLFWDGFMWVATSTIVWVPVAAMLLYIIIKNNKIQEALLTIVMIALVITLADQIASGLCKPFFARFRPTQDPNIMYMVDIVNGYRGGRFGFISSRNWHQVRSYAIPAHTCTNFHEANSPVFCNSKFWMNSPILNPHCCKCFI